MCFALNHNDMTFNSNHICDMLCTKSHTHVAKITKRCILIHVYMSPRLLKNMCVLSSVVGSCPWLRHHVQSTHTCPGDSRRTMCATLACLESFSVAPRLRLLQRFEIMRLPSDTFARRRLTVTPFMRFKFHYKSPTRTTMYSIFWYLLGLSRSTTHVASITWKLTSMSTVMIYPTSM